ncbi:MAG TPA: imidazole glycerol phosphate synthase cyclase subunit [Thermoanaerobaculia bacterium]|nr:imidazole glycerol phosphate synthase cyclase subunit [Thermoanaerobaculia bacterium]
MLQKRIIPKFLLKEGRLVKAVRFHESFREAGNPVTTAKVYDAYGVDELIFLDIEATIRSQQTVTDIIERVSREVFMPFTVGGGVKTHENVNRLLRAGADKISINTAAVEKPGFVREAAQMFGDQCITVAIDYKEVAPGVRRVFTHAGQQETEFEPIEWALRMEEANCGEILLCSIDRDGTMSGYDLDVIERASDRLGVPVIASSGAGSLQHCIEGLNAGASAIAISSMFLFTDHSPIKVRSYLSSKGVPVRASTSSRN